MTRLPTISRASRIQGSLTRDTRPIRCAGCSGPEGRLCMPRSVDEYHSHYNSMSNVEAVPADIGRRAKCLTIIRIKFYGPAAMIVCICKAVSDKHIRRAASEGVVRLRDLSRELGLGT